MTRTFHGRAFDALTVARFGDEFDPFVAAHAVAELVEQEARAAAEEAMRAAGVPQDVCARILAAMFPYEPGPRGAIQRADDVLRASADARRRAAGDGR